MRHSSAVLLLTLILLPTSANSLTPMVAQKPPYPLSNPPEVRIYLNTTCLSGCPNPAACDPRSQCIPPNTSGCCLSNCCLNGASDCGSVGVDPNNPYTCKCLPYNPSDPTCWYHDEEEFTRQIVNAANLWNVQGGANRVFKYFGRNVSGKTLDSQMANYDVLVRTDYNFVYRAPNQGACIASGMYGGNKMSYTVYHAECAAKPGGVIRPWVTSWSYTDSGVQKYTFRDTGVHELGHILGLDHTYDHGVSGPSVMGWLDGSRSRRALWPNDILGLRFHPSYGYGLRSHSRLANIRTVDATTWSSERITSRYSNLDPSAVYGTTSFTTPWCATPPCPAYFISYISAEPNTSGINVSVLRSNGTTHDQNQSLLNQQSFTSPAIAYGGGRYLAVWVPTNSETTSPADARGMRYAFSYNGSTWFYGGQIAVSGVNLRSLGRPTLVYDSLPGRFHLLYPKYTYSETTDGCLCSVDYVLSSGVWSWASPNCAWQCDDYLPPDNNHWRTDSGFAGACDNSGLCTIQFANVLGPSLISSMLGSHWPSPWNYLVKFDAGYDTGDYINLGATLSWMPVLGRFILAFKGFWYPYNTLRTRQTACANCAWTNYATLSPGSYSGLSSAFSDFWNELSLWFTRP